MCDLMDAMREAKSETEQSTAEVALVEFPVTATELHNIAQGKSCTFNAPNCPFSIRFLLKKSFKAPGSNFIVNQMVMQIIVSQTMKLTRKEDIATQVKLMPKEKKKEAKQEEINIKESKEDLF